MSWLGSRVRRFVPLLCGALIGYLFYLIIITPMRLPFLSDTILAVFLPCMTAICFQISRQSRCIAFLFLPYTLSMKGTAVTKSFIYAMVLAGPIHNIIMSSHEIIRVFECTAILGYNLSITRLDVLYRPYLDAFIALENEVFSLSMDATPEKYIQNLRNMLKDTTHSNLGMSDRGDYNASDYQESYLKKAQEKCAYMVASAILRCRHIFKDNLLKCMSTVPMPFNNMVCWVMELDNVCDLNSELNVRKICHLDDQLDNKFGENIENLSKFDRKELSEITPPKIHTLFKSKKLYHFYHKVKEKTSEIKWTLTQWGHILKLVWLYLSKIVILVLFISTLLDCQAYLENYLYGISYDNVYINKYFIHVDERRAKSNKILRRRIFTKNFRDMIRFTLHIHYLKLLLLTAEVFLVSVMVFLDNLITSSLHVIRDLGNIDYTDSSSHNITLLVNGTGYMAQIANKYLQVFNITKEVHLTTSNEECLPWPPVVHPGYIALIYIGYMIVFLLSFTNRYLVSTRSMICGYFYPNWERKRTLYLYNDLLKKHMNIVQHLRQTIEEIVEEREKAKEHPHLQSNILKRLKLEKAVEFFKKHNKCKMKKCMVCKTHKFCFTHKDFVTCEQCDFVYCMHCWKDVGESCYACHYTEVRKNKSQRDGDHEDSIEECDCTVPD